MAPAVVLVTRNLLTNSAVPLLLLLSFCRSQCKGAILPMTRKTWRVTAVGSRLWGGLDHSEEGLRLHFAYWF